MNHNEYKPNNQCKRLVDVELLRSLEGQSFTTFSKLCEALGWKKYYDSRCLRMDKNRLACYCELKFEPSSNKVTIAKVY